jgi:anti-repressor protein
MLHSLHDRGINVSSFVSNLDRVVFLLEDLLMVGGGSPNCTDGRPSTNPFLFLGGSMEELQVFGFEGQDVRIVDQAGEPWWVLKDVCDVLGLSNPTIVAGRLEEDERAKFDLGRQGLATIINESGLYNVILRSDKPEAKRFKRWITSEVLPSIRKRGGYLSPSVDFTDPATIQKILDGWKADRAKLEASQAKVQELGPKAEFYDTAMDSKDTMSILEVAKVLNMGMGQNQLFEYLRERGILFRSGGFNLPKQEYINAGYFRVIEQKFEGADGLPRINRKTVVYQKGVDFIRKLLAKDGYTSNGWRLPSIEV